jgi:hypothetical protein
MNRKMCVRWKLLALPAIAAGLVTSGQIAFGADQTAAPHLKRVARPNLPPGLPRPHYDYRTTIVKAAPLPVHAQAEAEPLISSFVWTTPLLPGSYTLPGYYGRPFDYYYQGAYYGGDYGNGYQTYFVRLPYACGVTGYC